MDIFDNIIDFQKFMNTNKLWNDLKLNTPWAVGYTTNLIESKDFDTKEEWRDFYFQSGEERLKLLNNLEQPMRDALNNFTEVDKKIPFNIRSINYNYGRTKSELHALGKYMYDKLMLQGNPLDITLIDCRYLSKYRIIGETWNGVKMREHNTIGKVQSSFPGLTFKKVAGQLDYQFGIDFEVYDNNILLCALQIKPMSYKTSNTIEHAKNINEFKNQQYSNLNNVPVLYVYSKNSGEILNTEVLEEISDLILIYDTKIAC